MPVSPLIRPLSPLQTQCAPSLPEPYSLEGAIVQPFSVALLKSSTDAPDNYASFSPECRQDDHIAPLLSPGTAKRPIAPNPSQSQPTQLHHTPAPMFHSMVGDALSLEMLQESYTTQLQKGDALHPAVAGFQSAPAASSAPSRPRLSSDAGAIEKPTASDLAHLGPLRSAGPPNSFCSSHTHPYGGAEVLSGECASRKSADAPSPTAGSSSLLGFAAMTSLAAAWPSYGAALLRKSSPRKQANQWDRRSAHLPVVRELHCPSSQSFSTRQGCRRGEPVSPTSSLSSSDGSSRATECAEEDANGHPAIVSSTASALCDRSAATRDRVGCLKTFSVTASRVSEEDGAIVHATFPPSGSGKPSKRRMLSALSSSAPPLLQPEVPRRAQGGVSVTGSLYSLHGGCGRGKREGDVVDGVEGSPCFDSSYVFSRENSRTMQPDTIGGRPREPAPKKKGKTVKDAIPAKSKSPAVAKATVTGLPASFFAKSCSPRHVYPALEECRRLLEEIRVVSPLLRRCLTPPRPLASPSASGAGNNTASVFTPTLFPQGRAVENAQTGGLSLSAGTTALTRPTWVTLTPRQEARRLYQWDRTTAAEDLSDMHGSSQQSTGRFATSVARQLKRLQTVGTRLYGTAPDMSASRAEVYQPTERRCSLTSSTPLTPSSLYVDPYFDLDEYNHQGDCIDDSPSLQLPRRLKGPKGMPRHFFGLGRWSHHPPLPPPTQPSPILSPCINHTLSGRSG